jgi:hypothetical protein
MGFGVNILLTCWVFWGAAMWNFRAFRCCAGAAPGEFAGTRDDPPVFHRQRRLGAPLLGAPFKPYFGLSGISQHSTLGPTASRVRRGTNGLGRHPSPLKPKYGLNGEPKAFVTLAKCGFSAGKAAPQAVALHIPETGSG